MSAIPFGSGPRDPRRRLVKPKPTSVKISQLRAAMNLLAAVFKPATAPGS